MKPTWRMAGIGLGGGVAIALVLGIPRLPVTVEGHRVEVGAIDRAVTGVGTLESEQEVALSFEAAGRLISLPPREGERVRRGALVGTLDAADATAELSVAIANRTTAAAAIQRATAERARILTSLSLATSDYGRKAGLFREAAISAAEHDAARDRLAGVKAELRVAAAAIEQARLSAQASGRQVEALQGALGNLRLISPLNGIVTQRLREPGQVVQPGTAVLTVVDPERLRVRTWVDETALGQLALGQAAAVRLYSHPDRTFPGTVQRIRPNVDRETHEALVDVTLSEAPKPFVVGQRADVRIQTAGTRALRLPDGYYDPEQATCLVAKDGRAEEVQLKLGLIGNGFAEVKSGLQPGDVVIRRTPAKPLAAGRRIRLATTP